MAKIATEREAQQIGGNTVISSETKCATKSYAESAGCKVAGTYSSNQLVQKSDLSKPVVTTWSLTLNSGQSLEYVGDTATVSYVVPAGYTGGLQPKLELNAKHTLSISPNTVTGSGTATVTLTKWNYASGDLKPSAVTIELREKDGMIFGDVKKSLSIPINIIAS